MKIILLDHQNNYTGNSRMMSNAAKNFDILATSLNNYFDSLIKIFSDLYLVKFSDISAKSFFLCISDICVLSNYSDHSVFPSVF